MINTTYRWSAEGGLIISTEHPTIYQLMDHPNTLAYNPKHDVGTRFRGILYTIEEFEKYQFEYVRISRDRNMNLGRECVKFL